MDCLREKARGLNEESDGVRVFVVFASARGGVDDFVGLPVRRATEESDLREDGTCADTVDGRGELFCSSSMAMML